MSSDRITARNRANSQKSTGPRSARGKAIVSTNARRHGATSKPDPTSVAAWLRIILDAPGLEPVDVLKNDRRTTDALALAQAEVRLCSARAALDEFGLGGAPLSETVQVLQNFAADIIDEIQYETITAKERRSGLSILRRIEKVTFEDTAHGGKRHRLLQRYVREANGHRKRAFQTWLTSQDQTNVLVGKVA